MQGGRGRCVRFPGYSPTVIPRWREAWLPAAKAAAFFLPHSQSDSYSCSDSHSPQPGR